MAVPQNPYVHMEDVEKATVKEKVSDEAGNTGILCPHGGQQPQRVLVHIGNQHSQQSFVKRNTGTQRLLRFSRCVPADARQLLKPPYTERYVRWCGRSVDKIIIYLLPD